ncbi:zinc finger CCCH domain-containing protein 15-like [Liolophura sinensis]|uniref:zinc finger CCCH domain-containing protein 15-like n=1 Tax=Liolophura sinensis TaxID=3198878 RepID=UPI003158251D
MPPKKKAEGGPNKKTVEKKKEKVIEDKTFGLKNKKGGKQQKFIKTVTQQVKFGNNPKKAATEEPANKKKEEKKKEQEQLNMLFKPVAQTVGKGVDPKSVLCAFFKQGQCKKGDKCKFSHDMNLGRKGEKRSVYADAGDAEDTMDNWDTDKLEDVVNQKHGETNKAKPKTAIICKFFLDAVENSKYGWFWECPNGEKCIYKHSLPPGFVLKKDQKKENKEDEISIEELIEKERAALGPNTTRVTLETFLKWKERKKKEKLANLKSETDRKKAEFKAGKTLGISGREMFEFNPDLVAQDDEGADGEALQFEAGEEEEEEVEVHDINLDALAAQAQEVDGTGTVSKSEDRTTATSQSSASSKQNDDEHGKLDQAAALPPADPHIETDAAIAAAMSATLNGDFVADMPIDEDLFDGEDLDQLEEDLDTLDLEQ